MANPLAIQVDLQMLKNSCGIQRRRFQAMKDMIDDPGHARVLASRRKMPTAIKQLRAEERRAGRSQTFWPQGWHVANFLREKGHDPFDYPADDAARITSDLVNEIDKALLKAYRQKRPNSGIQYALKNAAMYLRDAAKAQITGGKLGTNAIKYRRRKKNMAKNGLIPRRYGTPPPYGIFTGEFVKGIRFAWFKGKRRSVGLGS